MAFWLTDAVVLLYSGVQIGVTFHQRLQYLLETDSEQVPRGKGEKHFA